MVICKSISYWLLLLSLYSKLTSAEECFVLKNPHSGHVLDASKEEWVTLEKFTGVNSQKWKLQAAKSGQFYIINKGTGKVLDLDYKFPTSNSWIVVNNKLDQCMSECSEIDAKIRGSMNMGSCQKWYVHHGGFIVNACGKHAVDIPKDNYTIGVHLETWDVTERANQVFQFSYL